jgi:hypothetical protein
VSVVTLSSKQGVASAEQARTSPSQTIDSLTEGEPGLVFSNVARQTRPRASVKERSSGNVSLPPAQPPAPATA